MDNDFYVGELILIKSRKISTHHTFSVNYGGLSNTENYFTQYRARVLQVYPRFVLVSYKRGAHQKRECFMKEDCERIKNVN